MSPRRGASAFRPLAPGFAARASVPRPGLRPGSRPARRSDRNSRARTPRCAAEDQVIPDLDTLEAVARLQFDAHVRTARAPDFSVLRRQMKTSLAACERRVAAAPVAERRGVRENWRKLVTPIFKSKFKRAGKLAGSLKSVVEAWESLTATHGAIPIRTFPSMRYGALNAQQTFLAFMFDTVEDLGVYCQHATLVCVMLNTRWACRKGPGPRGPHMILYGPPGCGKSHVMETAKRLLDKVRAPSPAASSSANPTDRRPPLSRRRGP